MTPALRVVSLHDAAAMVGVHYQTLSRQWRQLGWIPAATEGRRLFFYAYAVAEWHLSYDRYLGGCRKLRWLPWLTGDVARVVSSRVPCPHFFMVRRGPVWIRRYHPPLIRKWSIDHGLPFQFLAGFKGVARGQWELYLRRSEVDG